VIRTHIVLIIHSCTPVKIVLLFLDWEVYRENPEFMGSTSFCCIQTPSLASAAMSIPPVEPSVLYVMVVRE
jgi:hypothetical protein